MIERLSLAMISVDHPTISDKMLETDGQPHQYNEETVTTAKAQGLLIKLSKEVTGAALFRCQLQRMVKAKVGNLEVELEALKLVEESRNEYGKMKMEFSKMGTKKKK